MCVSVVSLLWIFKLINEARAGIQENVYLDLGVRWGGKCILLGTDCTYPNSHSSLLPCGRWHKLKSSLFNFTLKPNNDSWNLWLEVIYIYVTADSMGQSGENQAVTQDASTWLGVLYLVEKIRLAFAFHPFDFHAIPAGLCTFLIQFCLWILFFSLYCCWVQMRSNFEILPSPPFTKISRTRVCGTAAIPSDGAVGNPLSGTAPLWRRAGLKVRQTSTPLAGWGL